MAKARPIPDVGEEDPFARAAARVIEVRTQELLEHADEVLDVEEIEGLHAMRVASRRLRAALEVFAPCFPRKRHRAVLREVRGLADALGERRDRDVTLVALERFAAEVPVADRRGVRSLTARVRREQAAANEALRPDVSPERLAALAEALADLVDAARAKAPPPEQAEEPSPACEPAPEAMPAIAVTVPEVERNGGGPA